MWKMVFNVEKCQVVNFAGKHNGVASNYKLDGEILATSTSFKYLGVQITDHFSWDLHANSITSTASLLEYACEVWHPFWLNI